MKKLVALTVTLALLLAFTPAAALAEPAGGSKTYTGHYYSIETEWTEGGTVVLESSEDSMFDFMEDDDPHTGECFRFQAVPDEGYMFVGWEYWQELYIGTYSGDFCYDRVYRPSGEFIDVHLNAVGLFVMIDRVETLFPYTTIYDYSTDNITKSEIDALDHPITKMNIFKGSIRVKHVKAIFAPIEYTVTATAQGPGTLGAAGPLQYGYFESVTQEELNAFYAPAPNADTETTHYYFSGWFDADGVTPAVFPIEGGDRAVVAVFGSSDIVQQVTITASAGTGGSVAPLSVSADKGVQADLNTLFTATPDTGYEFAGWTDAEGVAIADGLITPTGDTQVVATFSAVEDPQPTLYTITATAGPGGSVTNTEATVNAGEPADLNALFVPVPADEYNFSGWEDSIGNPIEGGVIAAVNGDMAVKAVFAITIDDEEEPGGEVDDDDDDDDDDDNDNPKTGGNGMPWIALLLFGLTGAGALATGRAMKAGRARR